MRTALLLGSLMVMLGAGGCGKKSGTGPDQKCGDIAGWHVCIDGAVQDGDHVQVAYTFTRKGTAKETTILSFSLWNADKQRTPMDFAATEDAAFAGKKTCDLIADEKRDRFSCVVVFRAPKGIAGMYAEVSNYSGEQVLLAL